MKNLSKIAMVALCGAVAFGFTSCSDDDDVTPASSEDRIASASSLQSMVGNYVDNVVYPTYRDLQSAADSLHEACNKLYAEKQAGNVSQQTIDDACTLFKNARRFWEQSEAFLYGPASDDGIDPHMDSWPLNQTQLADALTDPDLLSHINGSDGTQYVYTNQGKFDSTLGFHGLEFILFRNGSNRTAAAFNAEFEDGSGLNQRSANTPENQARLQRVTTLNEAAFASAVSGDLKNMTKLLEYEWDGNQTLGSYLQTNANYVYTGSTNLQGLLQTGVFYGDYVKSVNTSSIAFGSWPADVANVIEGCRSICEEVHVQKIGQAYRVATGDKSGHDEDGVHAEDEADYIESPYSKRSWYDYQDNIYSIKNSLYGVRGTENINTPASGSIMEYLIANYPEGQDLNNKLNAAISSFDTAKKGKAFIDEPGSANAKACSDAVEALDGALQSARDWCSAHIIVR